MGIIESNKNIVELLWRDGLSLDEIASRLDMKKGTAWYIISHFNFNKKYPRQNSGRFSSTHQYANRNKFTSEQAKIIARREWDSVRQGTQIIKRKRSEGVINPAWDRIGEKHWNWKGGVSPSIYKIRTSPAMREWRSEVYRRDNYTCQECSKRGASLHAHHILSFADFPDLRFDVDNGMTLCKECHYKLHGRFL